MEATLKNKSHCGHRITTTETIPLNINPYGGIPSNLLINTLGLTILILIFVILHKKAYKNINKVLRKDYFQQRFHSAESTSTTAIQRHSVRNKTDEGFLIFILYAVNEKCNT